MIIASKMLLLKSHFRGYDILKVEILILGNLFRIQFEIYDL